MFLKITDLRIPCKNQVSYLGITLDKKLNWKRFIGQITQKALNFFKIIRGTFWGVDPETAIYFYKAYIRSILDYGSIQYGSVSNSTLTRLDRIQNHALRLSLGSMKSTSVEALRVKALAPPRHIRREFLTEKINLILQMQESQLCSKIPQFNINDLQNKY